MTGDPRRTGDAAASVVIYRRQFLPLSETFIADHIQGLKRWSPAPAYDQRVANGLDVTALGGVSIFPKDGRAARWRLQFLGRNAVLERLIAERRAGLIHAHFLPDGARIARFARARRIPLVVTAHGYDATLWPSEHRRNPDGRFFLAMQGQLMRLASRIVCVSDFIRQELIGRGYPPEKLITLRLGVDPSRFDATVAPPIAGREGVLFVGRLVEKKGLPYLLEAWAKRPPPLASTPLRIVGDGPLRAELEALSLRLGAGAQFLGARPRAEVLEFMQRSRVFAFPSARAANGDAEGMGVVAMEAQALGTPVVAFAGGTGPEVIADGRSGLLAPERDPDALAACLTRLLQDDELAARLSAGGPAVVRERFDLARNMQALERLYDEVTGAAPPVRGEAAH